jgi:sensor histidine kinase YesM
MVVIFFLRLAFILILSDGHVPSDETASISTLILSNTFSLILLICVNILFVWSTRRVLKNKSGRIKFLYLASFTLVVSIVETTLVFYGKPESTEINTLQDFARLCLGSMIAQITIYCLVYMVNYAITAQNKMLKERSKANEAQYRYQILKRQVNPHFLFNSLNALDCLVCEEKTEQASTYIHKLAGVYRYMIKSEEEQMVTLGDELQFVEKYIDLMKVRFPDGLQVHIDIPIELMTKFILPCSLQLLIENATKHNVISAANPLVITIKSERNNIIVTNNISPKVTQVSSTGLGQKYIRQQYLNLCGKEIAISQNDTEYTVVLPLI